MKILVIGGTGNVGGEVVKELQNRNADIRLLLREESAGSPKGVEVAIGDLLDPVSVQKALHGVDKLYLLNAVAPDELTQGLIAYDLAKRLKLKHIVYHSVYRVELFKDVPHFASKLAIESALRGLRSCRMTVGSSCTVIWSDPSPVSKMCLRNKQRHFEAVGSVYAIRFKVAR